MVHSVKRKSRDTHALISATAYRALRAAKVSRIPMWYVLAAFDANHISGTLMQYKPTHRQSLHERLVRGMFEQRPSWMHECMAPTIEDIVPM